LVLSTKRLTVIISKRFRPEQSLVGVDGRFVIVGPGPRAVERARRISRLYLRAIALGASSGLRAGQSLALPSVPRLRRAAPIDPPIDPEVVHDLLMWMRRWEPVEPSKRA
jgi:hypothetical protein